MMRMRGAITVPLIFADRELYMPYYERNST